MSAARSHVDLLSSQPSLDNVVNEQQNYVDEDQILRNAGFPQSLTYILRAANLSWGEISCLPVPYSSAQAGEGPGNGTAPSYCMHGGSFEMLVSPPSACRRVCVVNSHPIVIRCLLDSKLTLRVLRSLGSSSLAFCVHHPPSSTLLAFNSGSARPSVPWVCLLSPLRFAAGWVGATCLHLRRIGPRLNLCRPPLPSEGRSCHQGSLGWDISRLCHTSCLPQNGTQLVIICCVPVRVASSVHSAWKTNIFNSSPSR